MWLSSGDGCGKLAKGPLSGIDIYIWDIVISTLDSAAMVGCRLSSIGDSALGWRL